eukprot:926067_1
MSLTKFLGTKKKLNAYFNNIHYFRQYSMEYRKISIHSNRNPNKKLSQKSKKLQNWKLNSNTEWQDKYLWDIEYLIEQMITERVLLNYFHAKEGLVKWLQINDKNKTSQPAAKKRKLNGNESDVNFINDANMDYQSDNDADDEDEDELEPMTSEYENTVTRRYALRSRVVN